MQATPSRWSSPACSALTAALALVASFAASTTAQEPAPPAAIVTIGPAERHADPGIDVPMPPRGVLPTLPGHGDVPVPYVPGPLPQPINPASGDATAAGPAAPGDMRFWSNRDVRLANTSTAAPEPSASQARDTAFMTANWWAGISQDSGRTFSAISPYTRFPAVDGGFCCDQRCIYVPSHDITVWFLQYSRSTSTQRGSVRVAIAVGRDGLRNNSWHSYVLSPQTFGRPSGRWFDYPDIALTNGFLYVTSNVFDFSNSNTNSVMWRMPLDPLRAGTSLNMTYYTRTGTLGATGSYRFAQGTSTTMYMASHVTTSTLRIFRWADSSSTIAFNDRGVPTWRNGTRNANAPNGVNWLGFHDRRVQSGYVVNGEYGFLWSCEEDPGNNRPFPFVRVARFNTSNNNLIDTQDVWNTSYGLGYPACATNARGDKGVVMATGGPSRHVRSVAFLVDQDFPNFFSQDWVPLNSPGNSPPATRWGDYFTCVRHPNNTNTFLGTGAYIASNGTTNTRLTWFSRERDEPTWVNLAVSSPPLSGVPIAVDVADRTGRTSGNSNFTRTYAPRQGYELTAPATRVVGNTTYVFDEWALAVSPTGSLVSQGPSRVLTVSDIGNADDRAEARYVARRTLTVRSANPASGVSITVSPSDLSNRSSGTTEFTRDYKNGTQVSLSAPDLGATSPFQYWLVDNVPRSAGVRSLVLDVTADHDLTAQYQTYTAGRFRVFGTGCPGTSNFVPTNTGVGTPDVGTSVRWQLRHAAANLAGMFYLGTARVPPLPLQSIGMGTCTLDVFVAASFGFALDGSGFTQFDMSIPNTRSLIGGAIATQAAIVDPGAATTLRIVHTNPLETVFGGVR